METSNAAVCSSLKQMSLWFDSANITWIVSLVIQNSCGVAGKAKNSLKIWKNLLGVERGWGGTHFKHQQLYT